jgi:hypothetical protein
MSLKVYIMKLNHFFDVAIVGAGPSGIFAAVKLADAGLKVALIDKSGNYYTRKNSKDKGLTGFGGAAMSCDASLDYCNGILKKEDISDDVFSDKVSAAKSINEVYQRLADFGLKAENIKQKINEIKSKKNGLKIINRRILPIGEKDTKLILKNTYDYLVERRVVFFEFAEVVDVVKKENFIVSALVSGNKKITIKAKNIIFATGKLSLPQSKTIFKNLGVKYDNANVLDIGVRIETKKKSTDQITAGNLNPKIFYEASNVKTRTFCWCPGGKVISYNFEGFNIIDGYHGHDNPTDQTNFGLVSSIKIPENVDCLKFGLKYIEMFNEFTGNKTGVQILKDFINKKATTLAALKNNKVTPTIKDYVPTDLNGLLVLNMRDNIINIIKKINEVYINAIPDNSLIYGPVLEKVFPKVVLSSNMESSVRGFYVVGDMSGKSIGIITGATMGTISAAHIISLVNQNEK